jgi:hypothetical protein
MPPMNDETLRPRPGECDLQDVRFLPEDYMPAPKPSGTPAFTIHGYRGRYWDTRRPITNDFFERLESAREFIMDRKFVNVGARRFRGALIWKSVGARRPWYRIKKVAGYIPLQPVSSFSPFHAVDEQWVKQRSQDWILASHLQRVCEKAERASAAGDTATLISAIHEWEHHIAMDLDLLLIVGLTMARYEFHSWLNNIRGTRGGFRYMALKSLREDIAASGIPWPMLNSLNIPWLQKTFPDVYFDPTLPHGMSICMPFASQDGTMMSSRHAIFLQNADGDDECERGEGIVDNRKDRDAIL